MLFKSFIHKSARYETRFGQKMKAPISMERKSKQDVVNREKAFTKHPQKNIYQNNM